MHSKWLSLNISYTVVDIKTVIMTKVLILDFCIIQCITIRFNLTYNLKKTKITNKFPKFKKMYKLQTSSSNRQRLTLFNWPIII